MFDKLRMSVDVEPYIPLYTKAYVFVVFAVLYAFFLEALTWQWTILDTSKSLTPVVVMEIEKSAVCLLWILSST